ncbi:hypothetical protein SERLA73DRAFT_153323 [Serpula lacrymans var. lacrymans S7.3]|uniref:Uncharacterized protein n=1 Tax=Serpula lacrymans var. lacrymans (strain S7.3) TaxID=936435 RepID=F8Q1H9_SERL3|nr:hypothetical protein SERLA73DRAFT_153323 [Serpula lacrymans var. lacrymans S7.3]
MSDSTSELEMKGEVLELLEVLEIGGMEYLARRKDMCYGFQTSERSESLKSELPNLWYCWIYVPHALLLSIALYPVELRTIGRKTKAIASFQKELWETNTPPQTKHNPRIAVKMLSLN